MKKSKKKFEVSKGIRKFIREKKAEIRRKIWDPQLQEQEIKKLLQKFFKNEK